MKVHSILICGLLFCDIFCLPQHAKSSHNNKYPDITIQWNKPCQSIDGFGVAQAGWARELFSFANREIVMDKMFGKDGLRLNILRGEIFPHYWENEQDKDFNLLEDIIQEPTDEDYTSKSDDLLRRGQLWISQQAKTKYHVNKLIFAAWSAPAWMKTNGNVSQGQLKPTCYQDFADYLAAFYEAYSSIGLAPYAISPSNEPGYAAPWNSSTWTAEEMGKFITSYLLPTFEKKQIPAHIIFGENPLWSTVFPPISIVSSLNFTNTILKNHPQINTSKLIAAGHGYSLSPEIIPIPLKEEELQTPIIPFDLAEKSQIPVWVTEISDVTPLDTSMQDGLKWSSTFHNYLTQANVNAIIWWAGAMPTGNNESLIILDKNRKDFILAKRYDVFGNYSRYITEGSRRIKVKSSTDNPDLLISAFQKGKEYVIVATNQSTKELSVDMAIEGASIKGKLQQYTTDATRRWATSDVRSQSNGLYTLTIPASSVVTFTGTVR